MGRPRDWALAASLLLCAGNAGAVDLQAGPASPQATTASDAHLIVLVVVDQLRADYLTRFAASLPSDGGFHRLQREGVWCRNTAYEYAGTETGPGHATIATGSNPQSHGIIGNTWLDRESLQTVYCTHRRSQPSAGWLIGTTLGDQIKATSGNLSTVVGLAIKDRAAILMAGHSADGAYWYEPASGLLVGAPAPEREAADHGPRSRVHALVRAFNASEPKPADRWRGATWTRSIGTDDPRWQQSFATLPEANPWGKPPRGFAAGFDHQLPKGGLQYYSALRYTPFANTLLVELAKVLLQDRELGLGRRAGIDLLCIGLSANDYVGHAFGPSSHEVLDITLRTDAELATLMATLDATVGANRWTLALCSDHGVVEIPERAQAAGLPAGRLRWDGEDGVLTRIASRLAEHYQKPELRSVTRGRSSVNAAFGAVDDHGFYLDRTALAAHGLAAAEVATMVRDALAAEPAIAVAVLAEDLLAGRYRAGSLEARIARSFHPRRSGDVLFALREGWLLGEAGDGYATSHGQPYAYDRCVPLLLMGPRFRAGTTFDGQASPADLVPTLCVAFGILPPSLASGRVLAETLQPARIGR